jgi:hypothetical protein
MKITDFSIATLCNPIESYRCFEGTCCLHIQGRKIIPWTVVYILSRFRDVTIDGVWIGEWDLLITYTHHSELQAITAPLLISTIHKSSQQPLSPFSACCVFNSRSLATASISRDSSASRAHVGSVRLISRKLNSCQL